MRGRSLALRFVFPVRCEPPLWKTGPSGAAASSSWFSIRCSRRNNRSAQQQLRSVSTFPDLPIFRAISSHDPGSLSVVHSVSGRSFTYSNLVSDVLRRQERLVSRAAANEPQTQRLKGHPVAFLAENSYDYVVTLLAILASDAIALPLSPAFPVTELNYILDNSRAAMLVVTEKYTGKAQQVLQNAAENGPVLETTGKVRTGGAAATNLGFQSISDPKGGMMLYTSGTTNRPKGVFLPHSALSAQMDSLVKAWSYSPNDRLLHLLPLHHIHGIVNGILAPLLAGSCIEFMFPFSPTGVWDRLASPFLSSEQQQHDQKPPITFLTAVPTIYNRLLSAHPTLSTETQEATRKAISPENLRLNISGSAALPTPTKAAWSDLSNGNVLLERYGMTEVGMALSCGLGFADRVDGSVGWALPSVDVRLVDTDTNEVIEPGEEIGPNGRERVGEIQLRGPTVFKEYWRNPHATAEEFVHDPNPDDKGSWFKTGDVAVRRNVEGTGQSSQDWARGPMYFIQGRKSVDIIKRGGEKVSALEVERELLSLPQVTEAAVLALPSEQTGHKVAAVLVLDPKYASTGGRGGKPWGAMDMRRALKDRLANFKIPQEMRVVPDGLPRNAMGKVNKKELAKQVFGDKL